KRTWVTDAFFCGTLCSVSHNKHLPIGMNVFVRQGIAKDTPLTSVFKGIIPFFLADVARLLLLTLFPAIVLWLPKTWGLM
ncbi:MAG: TRAP transporter large permease subunit, partial [Alphaproteobacteria bacterium]|nr:TRAP transporter large permease subunit [Alphaproteobacteria bacterium]